MGWSALARGLSIFTWDDEDASIDGKDDDDVFGVILLWGDDDDDENFKGVLLRGEGGGGGWGECPRGRQPPSVRW